MSRLCEYFPESGARAILNRCYQFGRIRPLASEGSRAVHVLFDLEELKTVSSFRKRLGACINIYGYVLHMYMNNIQQRIIYEIR